MSEYLTKSEKYSILKAGIVHGDFTLASGIETNVKFDFDRIKGELFEVAVQGFINCLQDCYSETPYDTIVTIANGANRLGDPIAQTLGKDHVSSFKNNAKEFYFSEATNTRSAIFIDDVFTRGTNMNKVAAIFEGRILGGAVLLNRSNQSSPSFANGIELAGVIEHSLD